MSNDWKVLWIEVKGYPWKKEKCFVYLKVFSNCLVQSSCFKFNRDVRWFNQQFITCCSAVLSSLNFDSASGKSDEQFSTNEVIAVFRQCIVAVAKSDIKAISCDLYRCGLCLVIIWLLMETSVSEIVELIKVCFSNEELCKCINREVSFLSRKICDEHLKPETSESEPNFADNYANELVLLQQCHPALFYLFLVNFYENNRYSEVLKLSSEYIKNQSSVVNQAILTSLHNLTACCYAELGKPLMAIMHWRKAVSSADETFLLVPLLYNLHQTYAKCQMIEPAIEMLKNLLAVVTSKPNNYNCAPLCVFQWDKKRIIKLKATKRHEISDASSVAYYAANYYLEIDNGAEAVEWYNYFLTHITDEFDPSVCIYSSEYQLPVTVPPVIQVTSEHALALYNCEKIDTLLNLDSTELPYCTSAYKRAHFTVHTKVSNEEPLSAVERNSYITAGSQLVHCVSVLLFKISALINSDCETVKREINSCLDAVDIVQPSVHPLVDGTISDSGTDESLLFCVGNRLSSLKAMLYFNLALALSRLSKSDEKEIVSALQLALRFDSRNIVMRWNVTLLLWDIGQREESIKTWCKTRKINYKLRFKEINDLKNAKQIEFDICNSATKKSYLHKDISILSELLRFIA